MAQTEPMTARGKQKLEEELKRLKSVERPKIVLAIEEARAHGDLSENAEYHAAKESQSLNEARISEIEDRLARADVIDISKLSGDKIFFGATIELIDLENEESLCYTIVGQDEADIKQKMISVHSPIARGLIGKEVGDEVTITTPGGSRSFEVVEVNYIP